MSNGAGPSGAEGHQEVRAMRRRAESKTSVRVRRHRRVPNEADETTFTREEILRARTAA